MLWLGVALLAVIAIYGITLQRSLVSQDELCLNALSQIGVQQNSRWDALTALNDAMKGYAQHERETLSEVIGQRVPFSPHMSVQDLNQQEALLTVGLGKLVALSEAYPALRASELYQTTMNSIADSENKVRTSRMVYNDTVTRFNRLIRQFPSSILAGLLDFTTRNYLEEVAGKEAMPSFK